jgi:hypothetical protein
VTLNGHRSSDAVRGGAPDSPWCSMTLAISIPALVKLRNVTFRAIVREPIALFVSQTSTGWPAKATAAAAAAAAGDADSDERFRVRYGVDKDED